MNREKNGKAKRHKKDNFQSVEVKGKNMETTKAIHQRRSIRRYLPDPVDRELIKEILEDAEIILCTDYPDKAKEYFYG